MVVHIKEIPALRARIVNQNGNKEVERTISNLILPHLHPDFMNKPDTYAAVSCFPPFVVEKEHEDVICDYILSNIVDSDTKIIFDNVYEGHVVSCVTGIHKVIKRLELDHTKCYFITGSLEANTVYDAFCNSNSIENRINVVIINSWERHIHRSMDKNKPFKFEITNREKNFLCFNRILRQQRIALLGLLYDKNLVDTAYYSFFHKLTYGAPSDPLIQLHRSTLSPETYGKVYRQIFKNMKNFPLLLNNKTGENTNYVLDTDSQYYDNSYFSLVTETFFFKRNSTSFWDETSIFFSEKIFKPIACGHPFILVSRPNSLTYLKKLGYKTFHPYIDETYDSIENDEERLLAIVNEVDRLCKQTPEQWLDWLRSVSEIVKHNYSVIINKTDPASYIFKE